MRPDHPLRQTRAIHSLTAALLGILAAHAANGPFPTFEQLPHQQNPPDPLACLDGTQVTSADAWRTKRRPELIALFGHYMYGPVPPAVRQIESTVVSRHTQALDGQATLSEVALRVGPPGLPPVHLLLLVPNRRAGPVPVVLGLNFCGNHAVLGHPAIRVPEAWMPAGCAGCTNHHATAAGRGGDQSSWDCAQVVRRGYALATMYHGEIEPDTPSAREGIRSLTPPIAGSGDGPQRWGTLAAWAWGLHRAVDYLHTLSEIDTNRIAVFGHSRNGKTALLAGALDERIDLVLCHQAGCGGSAPSRGRIGESVQQINDRFPHWFADAFKAFNGVPERLPFDQHCLVALCAPRPVLLSNATEDSWANPSGQLEMLRAADPVYRLLGVEGSTADRMPEPGRLVPSRLGYFLRAGKHSVTPDDWKAFLDFADRQWGPPH